MKKHFVLICAVLTTHLVNAQFSSNKEKYWIYKERLKNFVVLEDQIGSQDEGTGITANSRGVTSSNSIDIPYLSWSDAAWNIGYLMGSLAMEYKLLKNSNADLTQVKKELYYVIDAVGRLDYKAEFTWGCSSVVGNTINGFAIRDDVSKDFPAKMVQIGSDVVPVEDLLNQGWVPPRDKMRVDCITSAQNNYKDGKTEFSQDHWIGLYIGLSLVKACVDDQVGHIDPATGNLKPFNDGQLYFVNEIQEISHRFITYIGNAGWIYTNPCELRCVIGINVPVNPNNICAGCNSPDGYHIGQDGEWHCNECIGNAYDLGLNIDWACLESRIYQCHEPLINCVVSEPLPCDPGPICENIISQCVELNNCCESGGAVALILKWGFAHANEFIQRNGPYYSTALSIVGQLSYQDGLLWRAACNQSNKLALTLATIGNCWGPVVYSPFDNMKQQTAMAVKSQGTLKHWDHLILLHRLLHGDSYYNNVLITTSSIHYECLLDAAPCRGFDGPGLTAPNTEWSCVDRIAGERNCGSGAGSAHEMINGLSYLYYFNLYNIVNGAYAPNPQSFSPIPVNYLAPRVVNKSNYNEYDKKNFYASDNIIAGNNYTIGIDNGDVGRVVFTCAKEINLDPGFEVVAGAQLHAFIDQNIYASNCSEPTITDCSNNYRYANYTPVSGGTQSRSLKIFPNPTSGTFTISSNDPNIRTVIIKNILGQPLLTRTEAAPLSELVINLNGYSEALYVVEVLFVDGAREINKLILE